MRNVGRQQRLADLKAQIAALERRPMLGPDAVGGPVKLDGSRQRDRMAWLRAPAGLLQEVYVDEQRNGPAAFGFALGLARQLVTASRPAILLLSLMHEGQEAGLPYGVGLKGFGIDPGSLILGRLATPVELLWAAEEAIACRAVAAVVAEIGGEAPRALDFTVSRRLSLRAASGGASVFVLRRGQQREASAARLRWRVDPAASGPPPFDDRAPGAARWRVILEKARLGDGLTETDLEFLVDWTKDGFVPAFAEEHGSAGRASSRPAPHGAPSAALGNRLPQAS